MWTHELTTNYCKLFANKTRHAFWAKNIPHCALPRLEAFLLSHLNIKLRCPVPTQGHARSCAGSPCKCFNELVILSGTQDTRVLTSTRLQKTGSDWNALFIRKYFVHPKSWTQCGCWHVQPQKQQDTQQQLLNMAMNSSALFRL